MPSEQQMTAENMHKQTSKIHIQYLSFATLSLVPTTLDAQRYGCPTYFEEGTTRPQESKKMVR